MKLKILGYSVPT